MRQIIGMLGKKGSGKDTCANVIVSEFGFARTSFARTLYIEAAEAHGQSVELLSNRDTKESPLPELALQHCIDVQFVEIALEQLRVSRKVRLAALHLAQTGRVPAHCSARRARAVLKEARSPRLVMQLWGTEYRRKSKYGVDSYWLDRVRDELNASPGTNFVITDVRFRIEAEFVESFNGALFRVRRPELDSIVAKEHLAGGTLAHSSEIEMDGKVVDLELQNDEGQFSALKEKIQSAVNALLA